MREPLPSILSQDDQFRRARLPSLYSDFTTQRNSNPDGFAANTTAWISLLSKAANAGLLGGSRDGPDTLSLETGQELLQRLQTKEWGRPLAIATVIDEAVSQRQMTPYSDFLKARNSFEKRNWTVRPWWLLSWGLRKLGAIDRSTTAEKLPLGRFVLIHNIEEAGNKILNYFEDGSNLVDRIYPMSKFKTEIAKALSLGHDLTESDGKVMLTYLARDRSAIVYDDQTVKIQARGESSSTLSDEDRTISSLKSLISSLNEQIVQLNAKILSLSENAQKFVVGNNRVSALASLRSKKLNETVLSQRSVTLHQLEDVYSKIGQAADQVAIVRVMEASTGVLQKLHAQAGGVDHVEDLAERLRDEMSKVDETNTAMEAANSGISLIDEDAVEEELQIMESQAKADREEEDVRATEAQLAGIDDLPKVPKNKSSPASGVQIASSRPSSEVEDSLGAASIHALERLSLDATKPPAPKVKGNYVDSNEGFAINLAGS
ncbi:hypothetical protein MMC21_005420 [Puttea exsequens]|nr:hypothetical protein [Puttea exsequens]